MLPEGMALLLLAVVLAPVVYSYTLYPAAIAVMARLVGGTSATEGEVEYPTVTILVAAHNEERVIRARIENALASDYPAPLLDVLVVSDGSTDTTDAIVNEYTGERVRLLTHQPNRGKSYALNRAIPVASGSIVVMTDANTRFAKNAVTTLVRRMLAADSPLAVCGKLVLIDPESGDNVDSLYWRYESWQKQNEGRLAATLGANGGIYAFYRSNYQPIPDNTILDDMTIPLLMKLRLGGRVVFEERALAYEDAAPSIADEFQRRVRIGSGAFQSIPLLWRLLHPRHGFTALAFLSHKLLRWFTPHLAVLAIAITGAGLAHPSLQAAAVLWLLVALLALLGRYAQGRSPVARLLRLSAMFVSMNLALGMGFLRWLSQEQRGTWKRTARQ